MYEFPKILLIEFWHHSAHIWIVAQGFDAFENLQDQTQAYFRHQLTFIPGLDFLKIPKGRLRERDGDLGHRLKAPTGPLLPSGTPLVLTQDR